MEKAEALNASFPPVSNVPKMGGVADLAANAYEMNSTIPHEVHSVNRFRLDASREDTTVSKIRTTSIWVLAPPLGLGMLMAVQVGLNAIGAYGFLAKAHIGHAVGADVETAGRVLLVSGSTQTWWLTWIGA
jgi:hypothetical protein